MVCSIIYFANTLINFRQCVVDTVQIYPDGKYFDAILFAWFVMHRKISKNYGPTDIHVLVDLADIRRRELNMRDVVRPYIFSLSAFILD